MANRTTGHQAGFGTAGIIIVVAALLIIAGIGFFITNRNTKTAPAGAETSSTPPATPKVQNPSPTSAEPTPTGATLKVAEWGVAISLPDSIKDTYYVVSTSSADADGSPNSILIGQTSLDEIGCKASDGNYGKKPLAMVIRTLPGDTDPVKGTPYTEMYPNGITIGKYYYAYVSWASSNTCAPKEKLQALDIAMKQSIKSATAVNAEAAGN